jgi:predicted transposase YbfD/YdcC
VDKPPFIAHFEQLTDPRQLHKVQYPLSEILLLVVCATIAGCDDYGEISLYGHEKIDFLRNYSAFEGIPSHDTLSAVLKSIDHVQFNKLFIKWADTFRVSNEGQREIIAIDGKTVRRSKDKAAHPLHVISAWSCGQHLALGQIKTATKSNEIKEIPTLLDWLTLNGAIVTIDAMGCQKDIASKIREKEADYVLALKGNHPDLHDDVRLFLLEAEASAPYYETTDGNHGRIEIRRYFMTDDIEWLRERHPSWKDLRSIGMVYSRRIIEGVETQEYRFYITSLAADLPLFGYAVRSHWGIENSLHWVLDMVFRDDESRIRKKNSAMNMSVIKRLALNLINKVKGKNSIKVTRKAAAWNNQNLAKILKTI